MLFGATRWFDPWRISAGLTIQPGINTNQSAGGYGVVRSFGGSLDVAGGWLITEAIIGALLLGLLVVVAPEPVDPLLEELAPAFEDILLRAAMLRRTTEAPSAETAFRIAPLPSLCGGNPFAADSPLGRFRGPLRSATAS